MYCFVPRNTMRWCCVRARCLGRHCVSRALMSQSVMQIPPPPPAENSTRAVWPSAKKMPFPSFQPPTWLRPASPSKLLWLDIFFYAGLTSRMAQNPPASFCLMIRQVALDPGSRCCCFVWMNIVDLYLQSARIAWLLNQFWEDTGKVHCFWDLFHVQFCKVVCRFQSDD